MTVMSQRRIIELDYLKGVLILLVIGFHLVWFEQLHPFAKQVVYSFHMPGFLLMSGYLMNVGKPPKDFLRMLLWLAVPYIVMESGYIIMASLLPINEHIDRLTPAVFLDRLCLHPLGPYWYLHTLIICEAIYYSIHNSLFLEWFLGMKKIFGLLGKWPYFVLAYFAVYYVLGTLLPLKGVGGGFSFSSALYFLAGAAIRQRGIGFIAFFHPSLLSVLAFATLVFFIDSPNQASFSGALIAYTAISSLLFLFNLFTFSSFHLFAFLGRNSLVLYIFSPIFTILCKHFVPYLQFDPTGLLFLLVSLIVCVAGSLAIAWAMDFTGTSRFFFGKRALS